MPADRKERLDAIEFPWDASEYSGKPRDDGVWEGMFGKLVQHKQTHGDCRVKRSQDNDLGIWVKNQRSVRKNGKMLDDRHRRLDEIGFLWDASEHHGRRRDDGGWNKMFGRLVQHKQKHGDCRVKMSH
ncbi:hypothetical protein THAOC_33121, partial [Thalassiosira oceanica]